LVVCSAHIDGDWNKSFSRQWKEEIDAAADSRIRPKLMRLEQENCRFTVIAQVVTRRRLRGIRLKEMPSLMEVCAAENCQPSFILFLISLSRQENTITLRLMLICLRSIQR
jgi:hypothetical protein